jgi:outer membrane protein TolC
MQMTDQWVPQAAALSDPEVTFKLMEIPGIQFNKAMYANVGIEQMVAYPSKLSTRKEIAIVQSEHAHHEHAEKILDVLTQLKSTYAMLWFARQVLQINRENQQLLLQVQQIVRANYAAGRASQPEVLRTNIELERLKSEEASLHQEITSAESMLRATLNRSNDAAVGRVELEPFTPLQVSYAELLAFAREHRPMLIHDSLSIVEGALRISLMKQEYIPDFKLSFEYVTYPGQMRSTWTAMAGVSIPFAPWTLSKTSARVQEATSEEAMRRSMFRATSNMLTSLVRDSYAKVKSLEIKVQSFTTSILPQTEQSLNATLTEYRTGRSSFLMLLDTYKMYQEIKMESAMARMKYEQGIADLEHQVGVVYLYQVALPTQEN